MEIRLSMNNLHYVLEKYGGNATCQWKCLYLAAQIFLL